MVASPPIPAFRRVRSAHLAAWLAGCALVLGNPAARAAAPQDPIPPLVAAYGASTPWCGGPMQLGVEWSQSQGDVLTVFVAGAPAGAPLLLVAGALQDAQGTLIDGVAVYVKILPGATWTHLATTDETGGWQGSFELPRVDATIYVQAATANGPDCASIPYAATNALEIVLRTAAIGPGIHGGGQPPSADSMSDQEWQVYKQQGISSLRVASGWSDPQLLSGFVNSTGWEDSASISPDGERLYFAYLPADYLGLLIYGGGDLDEFSRFRRGPDRGNAPEYSFDTFLSVRSKGVFQAPQTAWISQFSDPAHASQTGASERDGFLYFASNAQTLSYGSGPSIWRAPAGQEAMPLSIDGIGDEHDPAFLQGDLYFWSSMRPGAIGDGRRQIWLSRQLGFDQWTVPECLPEPVNLPGSDSWQPHPLPNGDLYFSSDRDGKLSIWKSTRLGPWEFGTPSQVVWFEPGGAVAAVAEPSLPDDGSAIYFCVLFRNEQGFYDLDIAVSWRLGP